MFHKIKGPSYCLVLSGGGAKGIYHIGAWRALQELGIQVEAFIGNSIGAIVAAFLAEGKIRELEDIGDNIGIDFIMKLPPELIEKGELKVGWEKLPAFRNFYRSVIQNKGIDASPLRDLIYNNLDEEGIRNSGNDLGVVTFNISDMKPVRTFLDEMEEGTVLDFLLASAAVPGLKQTEIKGKKFIDGGVWDNLPYDMARNRGYRNVIIIDISGVGVNRKPSIEGSNTVYIKNSINMGGIFDFNREFLDNYRMLGYLDTLKTFDTLKGFDYFFVPDIKQEKKLLRMLENPDVVSYLEGFIPYQKERAWFRNADWPIRKILPERMQKNRDILYSMADCTAAVFALERIKKYSIDELIGVAEKRIELIEKKLEELKKTITRTEIMQMMTKLSLFFKEARNPEEDMESPYYHYRLVQSVLEQDDSSLLMKGVFSYYPELRGGLIFLNLMKDL